MQRLGQAVPFRAVLSPSQRLVASVNALTGHDDCSAAMLVQRRPPWVWIPFLVVFVLARVLSGVIGIPAPWGSAIAGASAGLTFALLTRYIVVAARPQSVVVASSSTLWPRARSIIEELPRPVELHIASTGFVGKWVTIGTEDYQVSVFQLKKVTAIVE